MTSPAAGQAIDTAMRDRFEGAQTFEDFLANAQKLADFWRASYKRAHADQDMISRADNLRAPAHLLVLNADWCGDSVNVLPYAARLAGGTPMLDLRVLDRDANLDLMDRYLTGGSRSIPKFIVLDESFHECGHWGPRPAELQKWVLEHGLALPKTDRYKQIRTWYARDGGRTTLHELLSMLEGCIGTRTES